MITLALIVNGLAVSNLTVSTAYSIVCYRKWRGLIKSAEESLETINGAHKEIESLKGFAHALLGRAKDGDMGAVEVNWKRSETDPNMLLCLGHPIAIRGTAIGMPHRLLHHGKEVAAFDDMHEAIKRGMRLLVEELKEEFESGSAPEDIMNAWNPGASK